MSVNGVAAYRSPYLDAPRVPLEDGDVGHLRIAVWRQPPHAAALVARHRRHRRSVVARPRKVVDRVLEGGVSRSHVTSAPRGCMNYIESDFNGLVA